MRIGTTTLTVAPIYVVLVWSSHEECEALASFYSKTDAHEFAIMDGARDHEVREVPAPQPYFTEGERERCDRAYAGPRKFDDPRCLRPKGHIAPCVHEGIGGGYCGFVGGQHVRDLPSVVNGGEVVLESAP